MASVLTVIVPVRNFTGSFVFWTPSPFPTPSPTAVPLPNNVVLTFGGAWKHHVAGHNPDLYCLNTPALGGPGKPSFVSDIYDFETTGEKAPRGERSRMGGHRRRCEVAVGGDPSGRNHRRHVHVRVTGSKTTVRTKGPVITIDAKLAGFASTEGKFVTVKGTLTCQQP